MNRDCVGSGHKNMIREGTVVPTTYQLIILYLHRYFIIFIMLCLQSNQQSSINRILIENYFRDIFIH